MHTAAGWPHDTTVFNACVFFFEGFAQNRPTRNYVNGGRVRPPIASLMLIVCVALASCGRSANQINCDNLLPAGEATYSAVAAIVTSTADPRNCAVCHNGADPLFNLNLATPNAAYEDMVTQIDRIYAQIAGGTMPKDGERWSEADVQLLRSWYCDGALHD